MDRHKELYKENSSILSPRQHNRINRELQQKKRANHRNDMYFSSRNISVSPTPNIENGVERISATSTPAVTKVDKLFKYENETIQQNDCFDKENQNKTQSYASRIAIAARKNDPEKRSRQEAYLMRFLEWKERKKLEEAKRKDAKKPFLPPSKNCGIGGNAGVAEHKTAPAAVKKHCVLPKSKQFKAPNGLVHLDKQVETMQMSLAEQKKKRLSIYTVVETPPRKQLSNTIEKKKPTALGRTPLLKEQSTRALSADCLNSHKKNIVTTAKRAVAPANLVTQSEKKHPTNVEAKPTAPKFAKPRPLKLPTANFCNKPSNGNVPKTVSGTKDVKTTVAKPIVTTARVVKPIRTGKEGAAMKPTVKPALAAQTNAKKPLRPMPTTSNGIGAVAKARQLKLNKQQADPPQKQTKLSVNLKSKKPINKSTITRNASKNAKQNANILLCVQEATLQAETPTLAAGNPFPAFVTSTQVKELPNANAFPDVTDEISPVETLSMDYTNTVPQCPSKSRSNSAGTSVKRALLQKNSKPAEDARKSRFNFVRYSEAGTDVDITLANDDCNETVGLTAIADHTTETVQSKSPKHAEQIASSHASPVPKARRSKFNFVRYSEAATDAENTIVADVEEHNDQCAPASEALDTTIANDCEKTVNAHNSTVMPLPRTPDTCAERPSNYLSPFVTVSRGKVSLKAEKERRNSVYLPPAVNGTPNTELVKEQPQAAPETPVEVRRALETVRHFRKQLTDEIARLHTLCAQWENYKLENLARLQETGGEDMINVTIGQTKLLTSKKFMQFNGLIDRCEAGATGIGALVDDGSEDTKPIRAIDLEGFWSMISLQVDNVDKRFENLETWKQNDWNDPNELKLKTKKNLTKVKKAKTTTAAAKPKAKPNSALQEMMRKMHADMRQKKAAEQAGTVDVILTPKRQLRRQSQNGATQQQQLVQQQQREQRRSGSAARRLSIIVPDRKSLSAAATIVSIPSPLGRRTTNSNNNRKLSQDSPKLRKHTQEFDKSMTNLRKECERNDLLKAALIGATMPTHEQMINRTPPTAKSTSPLRETCPKSILKTPGTAKGQRKSVIFNSKLQVRKFKFTVEDPPSDEEQDEAVPKQASPKPEPEQEDLEQRAYRLRGRKVVLRPSSEFVIPT